MTDPQLNEPIELPLIQDAEAIPEDESVLVTLRAFSDERRQVQILVPMTHEAADKLAGQLTAAAIQVRRRMRLRRG
jgi:hypothetical protein